MTIFTNRNKSRSTIVPPFAKDLLVIGAVGIVLALILPFCIQDDGRIAHSWGNLPFILFMSVSATRRYRILEGLVACLAMTLPMVVAASLMVAVQEVLWLVGFTLLWGVVYSLLGWIRGFTG